MFKSGFGKSGEMIISINNKKVAKGTIEATVSGNLGVDTFGIGMVQGLLQPTIINNIYF